MKKKQCSKIFFFLSINIIFLWLLKLYCISFTEGYDNYTQKVKDFKHVMKTDAVEVLFLGTSHTAHSFLPIELYKNYGIKSYNMASAAQFIQTSEFLLKQCIRKQGNIHFLVIDPSMAWKNYYQASDFNNNYLLLQNMTFPSNLYILAKIKPNNEKYIEWLSSITRLHSVWSEFNKIPLQKQNTYKSYFLGNNLFIDKNPYWGLNYSYDRNSLEISYGENFNHFPKPSSINVSMLEERSNYSISYQNLQAFLRIKDICKDNNIKLICIKSPSKTQWSEGRHETLKKFMGEQNIEFIDFNTEYNDLFDWNIETCDHGLHLNYYGALKATDVMGKILQEKGTEDFRNNISENAYFESQLAEYENEKWKYAFTDNEKAYGYLDKLHEDLNDRIIVIAVNDDISAGFNKIYSAKLQSFGLVGDLFDNYRQSYLAVIEDGVVRYENKGNKIIVFKDSFLDAKGQSHILECSSQGMGQGNLCQIYLDGNNYAPNLKGFNIVVYDKKLCRVIEQTVIDTFGDGKIYLDLELN